MQPPRWCGWGSLPSTLSLGISFLATRHWPVVPTENESVLPGDLARSVAGNAFLYYSDQILHDVDFDFGCQHRLSGLSTAALFSWPTTGFSPVRCKTGAAVWSSARASWCWRFFHRSSYSFRADEIAMLALYALGAPCYCFALTGGDGPC
jgi:hypothetical protein